MSRKFVSTVIIAYFALVAFVTVSAPARGQIQFQEGDFSNWGATNDVVSGSSSSTEARISSGGNPGAYWSVNLNTPGISSAIAVFSSPTSGFSYDPSTQGAITSLDFSIDAKNFTSLQTFGIALEQNGKIYGNFDFISTNIWTTFRETDLSTDLALGIPGTSGGIAIISYDVTQEPDFSATGAPITFGLWTANSDSGSTQVGYDNIQITVNSLAVVPEPNCPLFVLFALTGVTCLHSLRKRAVAE